MLFKLFEGLGAVRFFFCEEIILFSKDYLNS